MRTISAAKFKEQCLAILESVDPDGVVITKRGLPVARLLPYRTEQAEPIGSLAGKLAIKGDVHSTGLRWDAEPRHPHRPPRARRKPHST